MNVRVNLNYPIYDGAEIVFKAPCDASEVTGLIVYYPSGTEVVSSVFTFADAHTNDLGNIDNLFAEGAVVKVIIDTETNMAFVQNAATNAYLERRFAGMGGGSAEDAVLYTEQELTPEQQAQARANIGAMQKGVSDTELNMANHSISNIRGLEMAGVDDYIYMVCGARTEGSDGNYHAVLSYDDTDGEGVILRYIADGVNDMDAATVGQLNAAVGDISTALDELHAYAEALKGGESV